MGSSDEADGEAHAAFEPSFLKEKSSASSVSASASELLFDDLSEKTKLLAIASKKAEEYKKRCLALAAELASTKKRTRTDALIDNPQSDPATVERPKKKRSPPEPTSVIAPATRSAPRVSGKKSSKKSSPKPPEPAVSGMASSNSDDDVPAPSAQPNVAATGAKEFEVLSSVLCAYKDESNTTVVPGSPSLPYDVCADLCRDEVKSIKKWNKQEKARFHPAIISALHIVYKNKKPTWFQSKFLLSHEQTAQYWCEVLTRRAEIWDAAAARRAAVTAAAAVKSISLKERIRMKIKQRKTGKIAALKAVASVNAKAAAMKSGDSQSSSDSDVAEPTVVDLSHSPEVPTCTDPTAAASASSPKMAPPPDSYTKSDIKIFSKIAASIRDVDERQGFAPATINFIDTEFSDATGRLAKAVKSRDPWKQKRVDKACAMAAKIMEDRLVL